MKSVLKVTSTGSYESTGLMAAAFNKHNTAVKLQEANIKRVDPPSTRHSLAPHTLSPSRQ